MRLKQWVKNGFIFLPLFFSQEFTDPGKLFTCAVAFVAFSLLASSIYCFNDLLDIESDRQHPSKKNRPLASGAVSCVQGVVLMVLLVVASFAVALFFAPVHSLQLIVVLTVYFVLNIAYCLRLKHIAIVDVLIVATGFVLRLAAGSLAGDVDLSHWIVLMTFLLALFLAFAKRRDDVLIYEQTNIVTRDNIIKYNLEFLNSVLSVICAVSIVCYIMYTVSEEVMQRLDCSYVYFTSVFVIAGILRYLQLTQVEEKSGSPTKVLYNDRFIQVVIGGWVLSFVLIIYIL